jgi:hypothetical protein
MIAGKRPTTSAIQLNFSGGSKLAENKEMATAAVPVWTVETLRAHILALQESFSERMTERHEASLRAITVAFESQVAAINAALSAQKEAIAAAFQSQKEAVAQALASADRAVSKAELATEKRFEAVNEFRATLADQQRTLMPRSEAETIFNALREKLDTINKSLTEKIDAVIKLQVSQGGMRTGEKYGWQYAVAIVGLLLTIIGIVSWFAGKPALLPK